MKRRVCERGGASIFVQSESSIFSEAKKTRRGDEVVHLLSSWLVDADSFTSQCTEIKNLNEKKERENRTESQVAARRQKLTCIQTDNLAENKKNKKGNREKQIKSTFFSFSHKNKSVKKGVTLL